MTTAETWDLFAEQMEDNSTDSYELHEIKDPSAQADPVPNNTRQYTFNMRDVDSYILMSQGFVEVKVRLQKAAGTAIDGNACLENGACLFSSGRWLVNDKEVERIDYLNKKQLVMNLLEYSGDYGQSTASSELWYPDTSVGAAVTPYTTAIVYVAGPPIVITSTTVDTADYNDGFTKRCSLFSGLKVVTLRIPLARLFGFAKSVGSVSIGSTHRIILDRADIEDFLHGDATAFPGTADDATFYMKSISLWVPYLRPSRMTEDRILKQLADGGSRMVHMEYSQVHTYRQSTNTTQINWNIHSAVEKPLKVIIWMQPVRATTALKNRNNKSIFNHYELTTCSLTVGGSKFPEYQHATTFSATEADYSRLYHELLRVSDKAYNDYNTGTAISYPDFATLYPLICFDLRESPDKLFTAGNSTDITFKATLNTTVPVDFFAMVVSDRVLKMDVISRKVLFDKV